jgi:DNA invertase Pin-like site-specific DNA recombinase
VIKAINIPPKLGIAIGIIISLPRPVDVKTAKMVVAVVIKHGLATLSEFELTLIKERQREGIANAKAKGVYKDNGGNKPVETTAKFLSKAKNSLCAKELRNGNSLRRSAKISGVSVMTAQKVKKLMSE